MICEDTLKSEGFLKDVINKNIYSHLEENIKTLCINILKTIVSPKFPGALIPSVTQNNELVINIVSDNSSDWRKLRPTILAFAGPTLSSFNGYPENILTNDPLYELIISLNPKIKCLLRIPTSKNKFALRALFRMFNTFLNSPDLKKNAPISTSWLLASFQDNLNIGNRDKCKEILDRLTDDFRLDAINLNFLRVEFLATFKEWDTLISLNNFSDLCKARKTSLSANHLMDAIYEVHLSDIFESKDINHIQRKYFLDIRPLVLPMLTYNFANRFKANGLKILALDYLFTDNKNNDLTNLLKQNLSVIGWISEKLDFSQEVHKKITDVDYGRQTLLEINEIETEALPNEIISVFKKLSSQDLNELRKVETFNIILNKIEPQLSTTYPQSWNDWFESIKNPDFNNAIKIAQNGSNDWVVEESLDDHLFVERFSELIQSSYEENIQDNIITPILPYIVSWLSKDTKFPRTSLKSVYLDLLTLFIIASERHKETFVSCKLLITGILSIGLKKDEYVQFTKDIASIFDGMGIDSVYWAFEISEEFLFYSSPDENIRKNFINEILGRIYPFYTNKRLSDFQISNLKQFAKDLDFEFSEEIKVDENKSIIDKIKGKKISIYTLTERASLQAKKILEDIAPGIEIFCNSDQGGTDKLKSLSKNSDIFVIAWLSAKHAATEFIRNNLGKDCSLIYSSGRGYSSIIRCIEEHFSKL